MTSHKNTKTNSQNSAPKLPPVNTTEAKLQDHFEQILTNYEGISNTHRSNLQQNLADEAVEKAATCLKEFEVLKADLIKDIELVSRTLQMMKVKIAQNVATDDNEDGLLTHEQFQYEEFLPFIDVAGFRSLLTNDYDLWKTELEENQSES